MKPSASTAAKRTEGYEKAPNDLITARECTLIVDHRVSVLLAHWEDKRRKREQSRRPLYRVRRWLAVAWAVVRRPKKVEDEWERLMRHNERRAGA